MVMIEGMMSTRISLEAFRAGDSPELAYAYWVLNRLLPEWVPAIVRAHLGRGKDTGAMISVAGLIQPSRSDDGALIDQAFSDICGRSVNPFEATNTLQMDWAKRFLSTTSPDEQIVLLQEADQLHDVTMQAGSSLFAECTYFVNMIGWASEEGSSQAPFLNDAVSAVQAWLMRNISRRQTEE